jgi:prepilin-type N-terminal cleavage/methylation domain-containing protein
METVMPHETRSGFSLVELLIVVGVIVVLLGILVPGISMAIDHAERTRCLTNIRAQHTAQVFYATDNTRRFAPHDDFSPDYQRSGNRPNIVELMRGTYVQDTRIMICPLVARVPSQSYGEYRSNDWQANGIFGGWDTDADYTNTAYMWLANFTGARMFEPLSGASAAAPAEPAAPPALPNTVQMLNGEPDLPRSLAQAEQHRSFITHKINFFLSANSPTNLQDVSHGGNGSWQTGEPYDGYLATEQPVGFADGHVITRPRPEIAPRIIIGGQYPENPGSIGTFLW